jgi:hypothetical protein
MRDWVKMDGVNDTPIDHCQRDQHGAWRGKGDFQRGGQKTKTGADSD